MMNKHRRFEKGDLVHWDEGLDEKTKVGLVMQTWDSNVYEPEECEVFSNGETFYVPSKRLRSPKGNQE